jgi:histidine triad (HIT) family protein
VIGADSDTCAFCEIARGRGDAEIVCEGPAWLAFFPLEPATPGHTLLIPRAHVSDFWEADAVLTGELATAARRLGRAMQNALEPEGLNLITSAGAAAEQTVFHLHLHLVPRWKRDGFGAIWPVQGKRFEDDALKETATRLRNACAAA